MKLVPSPIPNPNLVQRRSRSELVEIACRRSRQLRYRAAVAPALITVLTLAGCNLLPMTQGTLHAAPEKEQPALAGAVASEPAPKVITWGDRNSVAEQSQLMYELMIAELAGRRGYLDVATEGYSTASRRIDDPRVAERATKLAVWGRRWIQAEESAKRWNDLSSNNPEVHQLLAQIYMRQGKSNEAAGELDQLIQLMTGDSSVSMNDIFAFLVREPNRKVAVEAMTHLRDKYPDDAYANLALAQLAFASRERDAAMEAVDRSLALAPENHEASLLRAQILSANGEGELGFSELRDALEKAPDDLDLHLGYARLLIEAGRYDEGSDELDVIYELGQDNAGAMYTIGLLALEARRNSAAEKYFTQLLALDQYRSEAHYYLGQIADSRQAYVDAIEHFESVTEGDIYIHAQTRAAELYAATGKLEIGRQRLHRLAEENPDPAIQPGLIRSESRMLIEAGQTDAALDVLNGGLKAFPNDSNLLYSRALAAESVGDTETFETDLNNLIRNEPDNAHALNALGYHYAQKNVNLEQAETMLVRANELAPQDPAILDSLGWLRYRLAQYEDSLQLLRRAYLLMKDPEIAAHLGEVLWVTGEKESAREIWDRALAEQPGDQRLKDVLERFVQ